MNSTEVLVFLTSIALLVAISFMWKDWLGKNEREHWQETTIKLSQQETERLRLAIDVLSCKYNGKNK